MPLPVLPMLLVAPAAALPVYALKGMLKEALTAADVARGTVVVSKRAGACLRVRLNQRLVAMVSTYASGNGSWQSNQPKYSCLAA